MKGDVNTRMLYDPYELITTKTFGHEEYRLTLAGRMYISTSCCEP